MCTAMASKWMLVIIVFYCSASLAIQADVVNTITIPLNKTMTYTNRELFGDFIKLNSSATIQVNFTNINKSLSFIVFQVHSQLRNVTLYMNEKTPVTQVCGTNVGLVSKLKKLPNDEVRPDTFYIENLYENATIRAYISVHGYTAADPIPGGCNMEFPVDIAPYLEVRTNNAYITVTAAPPMVDVECNNVFGANLTFYMMYLPEMNFYADTYFGGVRNMLTLKNIRKYGDVLPMNTNLPVRRMISAYPGAGVIFVAVAQSQRNGGGYSIYVPNHSYGCEKTDEDGCIFDDDMLSQLLCATLLFVGVFVSSFGHRFFKTEMFLTGFFSGFIITYILISIIERTIETPALVAASALSGVFFGAIWLLFWWLYGIPVLAVLLPTLNLGFLIAAIFYYRLPVNVMYLEEDLNFWSLFIMVMCLTALALVSVTYSANIICCAVLGSFATTYAFDCFLGSNLKYVVINTVRRAVVPHYNKVILAPPFQWRDLTVTLIWVLVAAIGWSFQHWYNRGRPPFPPPPRSTREAAPEVTNYGAITDERRQLLQRDTVTTPNSTDWPVAPRPTNERTYLLIDS